MVDQRKYFQNKNVKKWSVFNFFFKYGKILELPYGVGIVGKVGNELGRTQ